jgi:hypothetical protein
MTIDPDAVTDAIATAPAWALLALTAPVQRLREDGRREVAEHVCARLCEASRANRDQLALPL